MSKEKNKYYDVGYIDEYTNFGVISLFEIIIVVFVMLTVIVTLFIGKYNHDHQEQERVIKEKSEQHHIEHKIR